MIRDIHKISFLVLVCLGITACNPVTRLANVNHEPQLSQIVDPTQKRSYKPVTIPTHISRVPKYNPNSLWKKGAKAFFKDQRAQRVGDIVTVMINVNDSAKVENESKRNRTATDNADLSNLLGFETNLDRLLPEAFTPADAITATSDSSSTGDGSINRSEVVILEMAAMISQVLPNGNLVIVGNQEMKINNEIRVVTITGIIRPQDVTATNTIDYAKIAQSRIKYGGRGQITDVQQPRYGQQVLDIVAPY